MAPTRLAACASALPNDGTPCSLPTGTACATDTCGLNVTCDGQLWRWALDNSSCPPSSGMAVCASPGTPVATPTGERAIEDIVVGDLVYSVKGGAIREVPVVRVGRRRAEHHHVVRVTMANGRVLEISAPHPTADGRSFGDLRAAERLDGNTIESVELIPYAHDFTYDILPDSDTGTYFAAGVEIGSTLRR